MKTYDSLKKMEDKIERAIIYATIKHQGQKRKSSSLPYIIHPLEVFGIAGTITDNEKILCASILHDVLEDTNAKFEEICDLFGMQIANIVVANSENKRKELSAKDTWKIRKQETITYLCNAASYDEKVVAISDKLSNLRAIYNEYVDHGDTVFNIFNEKNKSQHYWYYSSLLKAFGDLNDTDAYQEYIGLIGKIFWKEMKKSGRT